MADKPDELRQQLTTLREEITTLSEAETLTEEQEARFTAALEEYKPLEERVKAAETRAQQIADVKAGATHSDRGHDAPAQINRDSPFNGDVRTMPRSEARDRAMTVIEQRGGHLTDRQKTGLEKLLGQRSENMDGSLLARNLLITESDEYHSAFQKGINGNTYWTPEEARSLNEYRALNEGTTTQGGFAVPVLIDPTIVLTSGAVDAPILDISTIKTITTNQWKGVTSAGFTWAFQAESAVVPDNTPTLAQPTIPVYRADGFLPYTVEIDQDWPGFVGEMDKLLAQGYLNLLAIKTMGGTGTNEPTGIFSGMQTGTGNPTHVTATTAGTVGAVDLRKAWGALPERFRPNATWVMNVTVENQIRALGNNLAMSDYTINMTADGLQQLMARRLVDSDYAPAYANVTTATSFLVVGDFSHFIIVQRAGMVVEPVSHLFDTATGRPTGQRGWFAWARIGHDADTYNAFRLLSNT